MQTGREGKIRAHHFSTPQVGTVENGPDPAMRSTEQAAGASSLIPRRIADKVVRINAQELRELSQQISAGTLSVEQFLNRIGLSSGIEVTLALPHERVVTLRRAGSRDVIWVDPAISVDLVNALVSGTPAWAIS